MSSGSPEQIENGRPASEDAQGSSSVSLIRGLQLEARVTAPDWEIGLAAVVQDFTPGEVILLLDDHISEGTRVTVQVNTASFSGEILFCAPLGSRFETHVSFDDVDATGLRRTPRFPVRIPARIFAATIDTSLEAMILDISGEGLGIEITQRIPAQTNIAVQSEENTAFGVVRHCRELPSGRFRAGVQLLHIVRKDPDLAKAAAEEESGWINKLGARLGRKKAERPKGWS